MSVWMDTSIYSAAERDRIPTVWSIGPYPMCIDVHRLNGVPDRWFYTCKAMHVRCRTLHSRGVGDAKAEALEMFRCDVQKFNDAALQLLENAR